MMEKINVKLKDATIHCLYKIYCKLWAAPTLVLDLFLPILTTTTWKELLEKEMEGANLRSAWSSYRLIQQKYDFTFYDTSDNYNAYVTVNFDPTSDNGYWYYFTTDSNHVP